MNQDEKKQQGASERAKIESRVFSESWQEAVFGHMVTNYAFFLKCRTHLKPSWFQNPRLYTLCSEFFGLYDEIHRMPTVSEFVALKILSIPDPQEASRYKSVFDRCKAGAQQISVDIISKEMTGWLKISRFIDEMKTASTKFNEGNYYSAISWIKKTSNEIESASFEDDRLADFSDPVSFYTDQEEDFKNGISTGSALFDSLLVGKRSYEMDGKRYQSPGLIRKLMTVLVGPTNAGKTSLIVTMARHAIADRKKVLIITHEQDEKPVKDKIYKAVFNMNAEQISRAIADPNEHKKLAMKGQFINKYLKYRHYIELGKMYVEDVIDLIKSLHEKEIAKDGKGFDLVIDDYPAKLLSRVYNSKSLQKRDIIAYVYDQFSLLAKSLDCHVIAPIQTNRDGYRQSKQGKDFIDSDSVSEAFGVAQLADNVITLNRSEEDKKHERVYLFIAKNRLGQTGNWYYSKTDLSKSLMYGPGQKLEEACGSGVMKFEDLMERALKEDPILLMSVEKEEKKNEKETKKTGNAENQVSNPVSDIESPN
jgi:KaiC/GvpD/RAD55 family RecA-like ATPase